MEMTLSKQVSWKTLVFERIIAVMEMLGCESGKATWVFNSHRPFVSIEVYGDDLRLNGHTIQGVMQRLANIDGVDGVRQLEDKDFPEHTTFVAILKEPEVRELHIEGRKGFEA